jgi:hypothetical protein
MRVFFLEFVNCFYISCSFMWIYLPFVCAYFGVRFRSKSESYVTTNGQSVSLSWNKAPIRVLRLDIYYCLTVFGPHSLTRGRVCHLPESQSAVISLLSIYTGYILLFI